MTAINQNIYKCGLHFPIKFISCVQAKNNMGKDKKNNMVSLKKKKLKLGQPSKR